jgi:hypothetical protein
MDGPSRFNKLWNKTATKVAVALYIAATIIVIAVLSAILDKKECMIVEPQGFSGGKGHVNLFSGVRSGGIAATTLMGAQGKMMGYNPGKNPRIHRV